MRDPYEVLGVAKNASAKDIKSAYRKLAKKHHPDQNPNDPKAKDRFAAANQAYEIVGDEKTRAAYDRGEIDADGKPKFQGFEGAAGGDPFAGFRRQQGPGGAHFEFRTGRPGGDPFDGNSDIFSQIFGDAFSRGAGRGERRQPMQAADLNVTLDISVEEAATAEKVTAMFPDGRKMAVKLPAYVEEGQTIRLKGQGEQGPGQPGDALVKIHIRRHPRYRIEGRDLHVDLPVDLADAVLGAKVAVETPTGKLAVNVPAWSSSDKVLRLKGRGLPEKAGGHGDLYAHVRLMLPEGGDAELEALMRRAKG
ncbi:MULTISPECIES: J domain-containing protein [unclassified Mesorhizobium]|uniref:DnaJ C-terminal domain-containing protein n=1 Tax=unclassified Mesorhizobium TaxID=325217 RepID=UPI000BAF0E34|nr:MULTISPECIES: J domain-containing protein [unclassified Mesorhizobium]TGT61473.1 J domain-containing protein [Mesorhizobium sp. M00.F.Ca.ET.170.01.1.1]PBB87392.1 molecular chaperone DnaJ [Mesorhizobium sp. WSM3876]RWB74214.1 MAG: J domain-containing protein [Mesorhizobium sp.]RWB88445.1 MAG: J domain-containing protein [Mesorhizobium sp.]RWE24603.1 MAG: J domain-containing protein [Mesorhizobium sp.]